MHRIEEDIADDQRTAFGTGDFLGLDHRQRRTSPRLSDTAKRRVIHAAPKGRVGAGSNQPQQSASPAQDPPQKL